MNTPNEICMICAHNVLHIFSLFYAVYIICFIHSHTCCVYCASSPIRFDSIFDTSISLSNCFSIKYARYFYSWTQAALQETRFFEYMVFRNHVCPKNGNAFLHLGLPKWSLRRKSIFSNEWSSERVKIREVNNFFCYAQHSCKTTILYIHKIWERKINAKYMTTRHSENEMIDAIIFSQQRSYPCLWCVRKNFSFSILFWDKRWDSLLATKCLLGPCFLILHGQIDCWSKRNGSIRGCFSNNERKSWVYVSIFLYNFLRLYFIHNCDALSCNVCGRLTLSTDTFLVNSAQKSSLYIIGCVEWRTSLWRTTQGSRKKRN